MTRERVPVPFTDDLVEMTATAIADARIAAGCPARPPVLQDGPKCDGCSLAPICLPDEVRFLRGERVVPPRTLVPGHETAAPLYVSEPGAHVSKSAGRIVVKLKGKE